MHCRELAARSNLCQTQATSLRFSRISDEEKKQKQKVNEGKDVRDDERDEGFIGSSNDNSMSDGHDPGSKHKGN